jgi:hypothetical protein
VAVCVMVHTAVAYIALFNYLVAHGAFPFLLLPFAVGLCCWPLLLACRCTWSPAVWSSGAQTCLLP